MFAEAESRPRDDLIFRSRISHIQVCEETKFGKFSPPTPKYEKNFFPYNESCMRNTFSGQSYKRSVATFQRRHHLQT